MEYDSEDYKQRGIDYDLEACLEYNPQDGFTADDIEKVLAVWEGENDGDDWRWILRLKDNRCVFLQGGCDYTGWDCQSSASHEITNNPISAAAMAGDMDIVVHLEKQLTEGKMETWREKTDKDMGL